MPRKYTIQTSKYTNYRLDLLCMDNFDTNDNNSLLLHIVDLVIRLNPEIDFFNKQLTYGLTLWIPKTSEIYVGT